MVRIVIVACASRSVEIAGALRGLGQVNAQDPTEFLSLPAADLAVVDSLLLRHAWLSTWAETVPVLAVCTPGGTASRLMALRRGAADAVDASVDSMELLARAEAVLRRGLPRARPPLITPDVLTEVERRLYALFVDNAGRVVPHSAALAAISSATPRHPRLLSVHVSRLRRKLSGTGIVITTVRGVGYRLSPPI